MIAPLISLKVSPYTPQGIYCKIYPLLEGNIARDKSKYSIFYNDIMYYSIHGVSSFLPPANFPMCQNPEDFFFMNRPPSKSMPCHPKNGRAQNLPPLNSGIFLGWQVLDLYTLEGGHFMIFFFWILSFQRVVHLFPDSST